MQIHWWGHSLLNDCVGEVCKGFQEPMGLFLFCFFYLFPSCFLPLIPLCMCLHPGMQRSSMEPCGRGNWDRARRLRRGDGLGAAFPGLGPKSCRATQGFALPGLWVLHSVPNYSAGRCFCSFFLGGWFGFMPKHPCTNPPVLLTHRMPGVFL